jgi:hypothetical protein
MIWFDLKGERVASPGDLADGGDKFRVPIADWAFRDVRDRKTRQDFAEKHQRPRIGRFDKGV